MNLKDNVSQIILNAEPDENRIINESILNAKSIAIFGAGSFGRSCLELLIYQGKRVVCFIDNNPTLEGSYIKDIPVLSLEKYLEQEISALIVVCSTWSTAIEQQLLQKEYKKYIIYPNSSKNFFYKYTNRPSIFSEFFNKNYEKFVEVYNVLEDEISRNVYASLLAYRLTGNRNVLQPSKFPQYFHPLLSPERDDIIIDGGAYIGDTVDAFIQVLNKNCEIYSFEPFSETFNTLKNNIDINEYGHVTPINVGLFDMTTQLRIKDPGIIDAGNHIVEDIHGTNNIQVVTIDDFVDEYKLTKLDLIKMDIEGSELPALKGARKTLLKFRPKMQICIYHSDEELITIPLFIKELFKDIPYRFYLGHHHNSSIEETVLYAIVE